MPYEDRRHSADLEAVLSLGEPRHGELALSNYVQRVSRIVDEDDLSL